MFSCACVASDDRAPLNVFQKNSRYWNEINLTFRDLVEKDDSLAAEKAVFPLRSKLEARRIIDIFHYIKKKRAPIANQKAMLRK